MTVDQDTLANEKERLDYVNTQIGIQLKAAVHAAEEMKNNTIEIQKSMWDQVNPTPKDLDDLANIWQFQTDLVREGNKAILLSNQVNKLERMLKNPYFARIDFKEDDYKQVDKIYIGISNIKDDDITKILVYDWRAPVCGMFYDYEMGRASYDCPNGRIEGEILLKRQYRLWNGEIQFMFDSSVAINDEILQDILGKSADSRMKSIVISIQREQNSVIRNDTHRLLAVTGPAGSGKTSVALHRAAYLLYRYRGNITSENIAVFSPNNIFSDYISEVLPELGEENIKRTTFYEYAKKTIGDGAALEDYTGQMEFLLRSKTEGDVSQFLARVSAVRYKSSVGIVKDIYNYSSYIEEHREFFDLSFNGRLIESGEEIAQYFREELIFLPVIKRLEKIRSRLTAKLDDLIRVRIEEVVVEVANTGEYPDAAEIRGRSIFIVRGEAEQAKSLIIRMTDLNLLECYQGFIKYRRNSENIADDMQRRMSYDQTIERLGKQCAYYEDIAPMLLLNGILEGFANMGRIRHVIIDEVQDYTPVQFEIFKHLFINSKITLLGDPNQAISPFAPPFDIKSAIDIFGFDNSILINLVKSYRSTRQIAEFCSGIAGNEKAEEFVNRDGELPEVICMENRDKMFTEAAKDIKKLKGDGMKSIAVILRTENDCIQAYDALSQLTEITLITAEKQQFFTGVSLIPSYLSKGLEFDAVLVLCTDEGCFNSPEETRLAYTVCTRALHKLHVYCAEGFPRFLKDIGRSCYKITD
jgi:DNA helicase-2/ATP-dependent DNA helicase PcrA